MGKAIQTLREHLGEISDLSVASSVMGWDQQTYMPPGGGPGRAQTLGTLSRLIHAKFTSEDTLRMLDAAEPEIAGLPDDHDDVCLVRKTRRDYEKSRKLPDDFVADWTRDGILSNEAWREARPKNDFAGYKHHLVKMVDYARRQADYYGYEEHLYDALLDDYEPELTTAEVKSIFDVLRAEQAPLVKAIAAKPKPRSDFMFRHYPAAKQGEFAMKVVQAFGYDLRRGRLDVAPHPFETSFNRDDVRITTRYKEDFPQQAIFAIFHEAGHGMYEQNIGANLARTPLGHGNACIFHESQSRTWENIVGRSRGVWEHFFPVLRETFPEALSDVTVDEFHAAINRVEPDLIRVEADECTYNMHIMVRFEIEVALMTGEMNVDELPEAWKAKMQDYLGVTPPDDKDGVLQDTHWTGGSFGYFPTYALGNVMGAQIFATAKAQNPSIEGDLAAGRFDSLFNWLVENVYRHGSKFLPKKLALKVNGKPLDAAPYIAYLKGKYGALYGV